MWCLDLLTYKWKELKVLNPEVHKLCGHSLFSHRKYPSYIFLYGGGINDSLNSEIYFLDLCTSSFYFSSKASVTVGIG